MLGRATYLVLMAVCLLVTLPLELVLKAGVYRRPRRWLAALVPVFLAFNLWDWVAIRRGHWTYSPRYTTGIVLLGLPLEELVFYDRSGLSPGMTGCRCRCTSRSVAIS